MAKEVEAILIQTPYPSLAALPANHDIRLILRQMVNIASSTADRQKTPITLSQRIVQFLYKTNSSLGREVYVALLEQLCHQYENVAKEAIPWLIYSEDEVSKITPYFSFCIKPSFQRKLSVPGVTVTLLRSGLIGITQQDQHLARSLLNEPKPSLQNFASALIRECLTCDPPLTSQSGFHLTIDVLSEIVQANRATDE
jgi:CCR4-NOT transcription complex subunit 1